MEATQRILETDPSAVELMDRMLINLTRAQPGYASQISFIEGDPAGVLCVEFYGETEAELVAKCEHLEQHLQEAQGRHDAPTRCGVLDAKRQADVWSVRKAGLGLLIQHPRRFQADPGDRGCLGAGRAPGRVRRRGREDGAPSTAPPPPTTRTPRPAACTSAR